MEASQIMMCNFGKYKGQLVSEIILTDKNYLRWLITNDISHQYGKGLKNILQST